MRPSVDRRLCPPDYEMSGNAFYEHPLSHPRASGAYAWMDPRDLTVLRVGKAWDVRGRLKLYWHSETPWDSALRGWAESIGSGLDGLRIAVWETCTPAMLEQALYKVYRPPFNPTMNTPEQAFRQDRVYLHEPFYKVEARRS